MGATPAPADQLATQQHQIASGGATGTLDVAALKLTAGATNVYRFSADLTLPFNGQLVQFRQNLVYALDANLKAALLAASAPMTQL
jgi:hypothetical protein